MMGTAAFVAAALFIFTLALVLISMFGGRKCVFPEP